MAATETGRTRGRAERRPEPDAVTAGYLRVSVVEFPEACRTREARAAHVEALRQLRRGELAADAARDGEAITAWYDDLGVSGRGELLDRRLDFGRLCLDARRGAVRRVYARDLSRLFRDLVQQELWFGEMESCGVAVCAQDLPHAADAPTRRLLRQHLGSLHEYQSRRQGVVVRAVLCEKVKAGRWIGRHQSRWGLRYDPATGGYAFDPDTADKARLVFAAFVAAGGVAAEAARRLNAMVRAGDPRATRAPWGAEWRSNLLLFQVRSAAYRRRVTYGGLEVEAPGLIPEVVPPALVAAADRLLAARRPYYEALSARCRGERPQHTYSGLLRCAHCGGRMKSVLLPAAGGPVPRVAWVCTRATRGAGCDYRLRIRQARIDALAGAALARAFALLTQGTGLYGAGQPGTPGAGSTLRARLPALEAALAQIARRRDRYLGLYAAGLLTDADLLRRHLDALDQEQAYLQARIAALREGLPAGGTPPPAVFDRLRHEFDRAWAVPAEPLRDAGRRAFLLAAGAALTVEVSVRPRDGRAAAERPPGSLPRRRGGAATLTVEVPCLGLTGRRAATATETDAEFRAAVRPALLPKAARPAAAPAGPPGTPAEDGTGKRP